MKKSFVVYQILEKEIHVPSTDYYAKGSDSETSEIITLKEIRFCDSDDEAETCIAKLLLDDPKLKYTILIVYYK